MNQTYIATTIGPIYQTIIEAKRSRAKWAASYFFSWFNKQLFVAAENVGYKILLPSNYKPTSKQGAGFYADRIYFFKENNCTVQFVKDLANKIINDIAGDIKLHISTAKTKQEIETWLHQYINLHIKEVKAISNFHLAELNQQLDQAELFQNMPFDYDWNPLQEYFALNISSKTKKDERTLLSIDAYADIGNTQTDFRYFRSIGEIATTTLLRQKAPQYADLLYIDFKKKDADDGEFIEALIEDKTVNLLPHHKYYAVMYADGDSISKLLEALSKQVGNSKLQEFSKQLFNFGEAVESKIFEYGGNAIYLGGEDILAFLPLACIDNNGETTNTLFNLIKEIDYCFENTVQKMAKENDIYVPTLSYGIMVAYYKYPLKEAMDKAHILMDKAKDTNHHPTKNTVGFRLQKHSGQFMECFINKHKISSYNSILGFIKKYTENIHYNTEDIENELLSGFIHRFKDPLFKSVLIPAADKKRLEPFFENFFNETIHEIEGGKGEFLKKVKLLIETIFDDYRNDEEAINILYTIMRIVHFINSKKDQDA